MAENRKTKIPKAATKVAEEWWNKLSDNERLYWVREAIRFVQARKKEKKEGTQND